MTGEQINSLTIPPGIRGWVYDPLPNAIASPLGEALYHGLSGPKLRWKVAPWRPVRPTHSTASRNQRHPAHGSDMASGPMLAIRFADYPASAEAPTILLL